MLWHITKREIYDHFTSLRFALTVGLITLLMVLNALIFVGGDYKRRLSTYSKNIAGVSDKVREECRHLNELAIQGPVGFYKRPSSLAFCANDQEDMLPRHIGAEAGRPMILSGSITAASADGSIVYSVGGTYKYSHPWRLEYVRYSLGIPGPTAMDWSFIIGVIMSFVALLFTFDAIAGEREQGTLALTMSNAVSRGTILVGKFLGAFIVIAVPMLIGMLLSLLIVMLSGVVSFSRNDWTRIGLMVVLSFIYISLFIGLGLAISSRMAHSSTSLLVLLLIWVFLVALVPNTLGSVVSTLRQVPSQRDFQQKKGAIMQTLEEREKSLEMFKYGSPSDPNPRREAIDLWADLIKELTETERRFYDEHLDAQFAQVQLARQILRVSPTVIYNYAMEMLAGTGFERHRQFVQAVRRYRSQFIEFIKTADRADPESFHVYYLKEGLSEKPVSFENVPRFVESTGVGIATKNALTDLSLLLLFSALLFLASYVAFLRCDVM